MIKAKMGYNIRGFSPFQRKAKEKKVKADSGVDICLECNKTDCKRGYCEKMKR